METLESRLDDLVAELELAGDWTDRYRMLVTWGEELTPLDAGFQTPDWEVSGCSSPLWLRAVRTDGVLAVSGASPGILPKALVALVVRVFDGLASAEGTAASVLDRLDLRRHLSPTRFLVLERMVNRALEAGRAAP
jgi:cysteine desulfuration protein SufE